MQSGTFLGFSKSKSWMVYRPYGVLYGPYTTSAAFGPNQGTSFESSVNAGKFVKGVYRCNPYSIGSQQFLSEDNLSLKVSWSDGGYEQSVIASGRFLTKYLWEYSGKFADTYEDLRTRVVTRAFAKLGRSQLELGVELGELKETLGMILNPLSSARRYLAKNADKGFRNLADVLGYRRTGRFRNERKGPSAKKAAEDTWMELRYGLRPLLGSIQSIMDYLEEETKKPDGIQSVRSRLSNIPGKRTVSATRTSDASQAFRIPVTIVVEDKIDALGIAHFKQVKPWKQSTKLGLDKRYLPEVMWELTSRSFVWDWFLGIGDTLALFRENPEIVVLGGCGSVKITRTVTCTAGPTAWIASYPTAVCNCNAQGTAAYTKFQRVCGLQPSYIPIFYGTSKLDLAKIVDLAIMGQQSIIKGTQKHMR